MAPLNKERLVYEDNHLLVACKLPGELVQGDITGDVPLLEKVRHYIKVTYNKPGNVYCGLVHRLDRPTSGLVVFAKTSKALARLNAIFQNREVEKTYYAVTKKAMQPAQGKLTHYLKKNSAKNKSFVGKAETKGAKKAELTYRLISTSQNYFLYEVGLLTGRHHQIRAQFAAAGAPLKGDLKYGFPRSNSDGSISLHAGKMNLLHPVTKEKLTFKVLYPGADEIWHHLKT